MPEVRKKLSRYIIAAFFLNIFAIMSVGAVCISLVGNLVNNIKEIKVESEDVFTANDVNIKVSQIIYAIDKAIIKADRQHLNYASDIIHDLIGEVNAFLADRAELGHDRDEQEKLGNILPILQQISEKVTILLENPANIMFDPELVKDLGKLGSRVQAKTVELKDYHAPIITTLVDDSYHKMRSILALYLLSSLIGILASIVGYIILTRNTITPIMNLARATQDVASGDLSVRVDSRSQTEIGALYQSFNLMTSQLENHEQKRVEFANELERQVEARTAELREANENLKRTQSDLVRMEKIATLGQIASSVNHEIKTPLNSLYLNQQLLARKIRKYDWHDDKTRDSLLSVTDIIDNEIKRISEILDEFVQYARFAPPNLMECNVNDLVVELLRMVGESAREAKVEIVSELVDGPLNAMIDRKKITQALLNLSVNAIHAMPDGGHLKLITQRTKNGEIVIRVADDGIGIKEQDLKKIFEPFFTTKEKGTGFGLAIVRRIIEDHRGKITCRSKVGEGTEFEIVLPEPGAARRIFAKT
ncbi:MAG: HAMP domain-containing protein [Proteobacteria bacterium]|nr:HAMP domain-containing protein [Pseudomonadota bacterium]MBU1738017.1 HAMP domain-containing protein [Pseudomonadota bacterium]